MFNLDNLLKIAEVACESAIKAGAEFADVSVSQNKTLSTDVEANKIKSCESQLSGGISVRAIYKGGTGYSNSDDISIEGAKKAGENSALLAKLAEPDPDFVSLVSPAKTYPVINGLNDEKLLSLDIKDIIKFAEDNVKEAESAYAGSVVECSYSVYYNWSAFVNSLGVKLSSEKSMITGFCNAIVKDGDDVGAFYDYDSSRNLDGFNHIGLGERAVTEAKRYLGAKKIPTQRMSLVLGPLASMSVLGEVPSAANAEAVNRKRSYLIGLEGKQVASEILTLVDDPLIDYGLFSRSADGEGTPCSKFTIIENGVLKSYLYSSYTANKAGVKPTGHGNRDGNTTTSNLIPKLGKKTADEIIADTKNGIYINSRGLNANMITGDVSDTIDFGIRIENGELTYPVQSSMIGGNILDILKNIDAISSDYRGKQPGSILPTIRIDDVLVAGAE